MTYVARDMKLHFQVILVLLCTSLIGSSTAEFEHEVPQKLRAAPHKTVGHIIDGTGMENSFNFEDANDVLGERNGGSSKVSVSTVALFTLAMAAATGLGAVPFFFVELDPQWPGLCNGMEAGVMLAASFDLIQEGQEHGSGNWVVIGILAGGVFIWLCKQGADAAKVVLVIGIMTLHSFGEGSGLGVSFAGSKGFFSRAFGNFGYRCAQLTRGISCEHGASIQRCFSAECYVMECNYIFTSGFAAGCMIWMVVAEVLPDAFKVMHLTRNY
ncbi:Zinc transporter [Quillaja saponaria]|uniref:Zinc transporter n=1 Tax=Quillaja saponaria TaxID=32244 RepID=A0AAD7PCR9_QUISA|nr:Zinc transporter [Quillaja saponaria]